MSFKNSNDDLANSYKNDDTVNGLDNERKSEELPVSAGTRSKTDREEEKRASPGPACSKERAKSRSRSSSAASDRRSRRRMGFNANRGTTDASGLDQGEEEDGSSSVVILSDDAAMDVDEEFFSPEGSREPSLKRKIEEGEEASEVTQRKQGRPLTTGLYIGRAKAREAYNQQERVRANLEEERIFREMTPGQLFSRLEKDLETAIEEMENTPTADVANQARSCMAQVARVAKGSKNLQGGYVKLLKQAAVVGAATAEVLRTRADKGEDEKEISRQLRAMRSELAEVRREAQLAREEADALRKELAEEREKARGKTRRRVIVDDDSPPPSPTRNKAKSKATETGDPEESPNGEEVSLKNAVSEAPPLQEEREYNDAARKREILPPRKEWPVVLRPPIRGKTTVLDDRPSVGHVVRLGKMPTTTGKKGKNRKDKRPPPQTDTKEEEKGGAQMLLQQITPLLKRWLEESLRSLGIVGKAERNDAKAIRNKR